MKNKIIKITIIALSAAYMLLVVSTFTADRLYSMSLSVEPGGRSADTAVGLIDKAIILDPGNAELYFRKYELLDLSLRGGSEPTDEAIPKNEIRKQQLFLLKKCIVLRPFWPKYHLLYGLTLRQMSPVHNIMTRQKIKAELKMASDLKPFSTLYDEIYIDYLKETFQDAPQNALP